MTHSANTTEARERYVIFASASLPHKVAEEFERLNISYKQIEGSWRGEREVSYIVNHAHWGQLKKLHICSYAQYCYLHLGPVDERLGVRPAILEFAGWAAAPEFIGWLWPVSRDTALTRDTWSRDGDQYYVASIQKP